MIRLMRKTEFRRLLLLLLAAFLLIGCNAPATEEESSQSGGLSLDVFAVGKADAMLLRVDGHAVLIDTGENGDGDELADWLTERGVERLDLMILTHHDKDHIGGADAILERFSVDAVRMPAYESTSKQYQQLAKALTATDTIVYRMDADATFSLGGADFIIWVSTVPYDGKNDNEQSLVTKVVYGGKTYLLMGDAEEAWLKALCFSSKNLTCDILKVPHHGVYDDSLFALLTLTMPSTAIITDSEKNPADARTLSLLNDFGVQTFRTAKGSILITQRSAAFSASYTD